MIFNPTEKEIGFKIAIIKIIILVAVIQQIDFDAFFTSEVHLS